ncbi:MAG: toprim domain-containing protein [Desulfobacterales bacterium]|nr:toprim domain-containing protein [Desulfobacterales bacterium]
MMVGASYNLFQPIGARMLGWLTEKRGLTVETIKAAGLGYLPLDRWETAPAWGLVEILKDDGTAKKLWFPRGLTIPLCTGDQVLRVRIRRPKSAGDPRYFLVRGSDTRAMILSTDKPSTLLVESELDSLLLHQMAGDLVNVIALGNAQTRPDQQIADLLNQSKLILVALDADQAGAAESWGWWKKEHYPQAHRWPPVAGKDPGDMLAAGVNLRTWVEAGLMEYAANLAAQPERPLHQAGAEEELAVEEHHEPPPSSHFATCEPCPWYASNPWSHDPTLLGWCHRRMEPLAAGSPACEEFRHGEVPPRQPYEKVPAVPAATSPALQERILTCFDCTMHEHDLINPPAGWGRCTFKDKWRYGLRPACEDIGGKTTL